MRIPKVIFDIYSKLNNSKLTKLNSAICQNITIYNNTNKRKR